MKPSILHFVPLVVVGVLTLGVATKGLSQPRLQPDFRYGIDSLRPTSVPEHTLDDMLNHNGRQTAPTPARKVLSPQTQIYVIDTAIVRRLGSPGGLGTYIPGDTTRHLYSFDANAKRTSDLTQKLIGDLWVDSLLRANTYDASNNMLSDLYECWSDGQWMNVKRYTYTYDTYRNRLAELYETWDGQWVNAWRYTRTFDANGHQRSELYEEWSNGQLVTSWRYTNTFDANGHQLSGLYETWNGQWTNVDRYTYTCDANGNRLTELYETWNGQWVNSSRATYIYDANGNCLTELSQVWSTGQWVNANRKTHTYDASNSKLSDLVEYWDGQWKNVYYFTYNYDANNNMLTAVRWQWTSTFPDWSAWDKHIYTYDASNNMLTDLYLRGAWPAEWWWEFVNRSRHTYTYDANSNMLSDLYEEWSTGGSLGEWGESSRWTYTYDANGNLISAWLNKGSYPNGVLGLTDRAENNYSYWGYRFTLTRKLTFTGVASQEGDVPATISLSQNYPNPFNPSTTIKYELPKSAEVRLSVFDMLGREVSVLVNDRRDAGVHEVKFDGVGLSSGVYFYRLQAGDFVQTRKLLLLK